MLQTVRDFYKSCFRALHLSPSPYTQLRVACWSASCTSLSKITIEITLAQVHSQFSDLPWTMWCLPGRKDTISYFCLLWKANTLLCVVLNGVWLAKLINPGKGFLLMWHNGRTRGGFEVSLFSSGNASIPSIAMHICTAGTVFYILVFFILLTFLDLAATCSACIASFTSLIEEHGETNYQSFDIHLVLLQHYRWVHMLLPFSS